MKKRYITLTILIFFVVNFSLSYAAPSDDNLGIDAKACILIDSKTGLVLYDQNADKPHLYPASTTKMMTAILAIENAKPDQIMTASQKAIDDIGDGGMNIGIMPGEQMTMEQLLKPLLISSANEAANIISENVFESQDEFIEQMNRKAQEIGAVNTHFVNPSGMHDPDHYTTARDLATIARYAMTLPLFRETVGKKDYKLDPTNKHSEWPILGTGNKLLYRKSDYFTKVTGIKTGYTSEAGHNLVSSAVNADGMELIAVVMGVFGPNAKVKTEDYCQELLEYGFKNYKIQQIIGANQPIKDVSVKDAKNDTRLNLVTASSVDSVLPLDKNKWSIVSDEHIETNLKAPIKKGDVFGYIEYKMGGVLLGKTAIIAANDVEMSPKAILRAKVNSITGSSLFKIAMAVVAVLLFILMLRLILRRISRSFRRSKRSKY